MGVKTESKGTTRQSWSRSSDLELEWFVHLLYHTAGSLGSRASAGFTCETCTLATILSTFRAVGVVSGTRKGVPATVSDAFLWRPSYQSGSSKGSLASLEHLRQIVWAKSHVVLTERLRASRRGSLVSWDSFREGPVDPKGVVVANGILKRVWLKW